MELVEDGSRDNAANPQFPTAVPTDHTTHRCLGPPVAPGKHGESHSLAKQTVLNLNDFFISVFHMDHRFIWLMSVVVSRIYRGRIAMSTEKSNREE
jgi:hypothetical protein